MVLTGPVIRRRLAACMLAFFVLFLILSVRLFILQGVQAEDLQRRAQAQWTSESAVRPTRGEILDRNGAVLAQSATAYTVCASPRQIANAETFARLIAPILDMDESAVRKKVSDKSKGGVTIKRQVSRETAQQLRMLLSEHKKANSKAVSGLYLEEESKRYYPMGALACQLIGLTTIDGVGQAGLESALDNYLSGKNGRVLGEIDGKGRALSYGASEYVPAVDGGSAILTIDASIQSFCETAAREALSVNKAKAVRILAMNPKTGEILAMVNAPGFDLNDPPRSDIETLTERMRNRLLTDAYEPGSTFKIITAASALDSGVVTVGEGFYCSGSTHVDGSRVRCWGKPHGAETFAQALENSCNPVFVEMGLRLGAKRFYDYLGAFGIGKATDVDIPGEASGIVIAEKNVKRVDLARIGFGQSVAVTPIQLLTAACAAINGGNLMRPYVVSEILDGNGNTIEKNQPKTVANPIKPETSETMRKLLEGVVENGGGKNARVAGYRIGGKTGTAQVYVDGVVTDDMHIGSFLGFAPTNDPQIAILVIVDEASVPVDFGSQTAAPFARDILEKSLAYLGIAPETGMQSPAEVSVPDVTDMTVADAKSAMKEANLSCVFDGSGERVVSQLPAPGAKIAEGALVMLYVDKRTPAEENDRVRVPDVTGLSVLEANRLLASYGLKMQVEGGGIARSQKPAANEEVYPTAVVTVEFSEP